MTAPAKIERAEGGPAFPNSGAYGHTGEYLPEGGMTLRDWFAGQAIGGLCADPSNHQLFSGHGDAAINAYAIADAMLAARGGS
mgnify:CR=1 FL=1